MLNYLDLYKYVHTMLTVLVPLCVSVVEVYKRPQRNEKKPYSRELYSRWENCLQFTYCDITIDIIERVVYRS